jgi:hypothetical protein
VASSKRPPLESHHWEATTRAQDAPRPESYCACLIHFPTPNLNFSLSTWIRHIHFYLALWVPFASGEADFHKMKGGEALSKSQKDLNTTDHSMGLTEIFISIQLWNSTWELNIFVFEISFLFLEHVWSKICIINPHVRQAYCIYKEINVTTQPTFYLITYSLNNYLLYIYYVQSSVLDTSDAIVNKAKCTLTPLPLTSYWSKTEDTHISNRHKDWGRGRTRPLRNMGDLTQQFRWGQICAIIKTHLACTLFW